MKVPFKKPLEDVGPPEYVPISELNDGQLMAEKQAKDYLPAAAGGHGEFAWPAASRCQDTRCLGCRSEFT